MSICCFSWRWSISHTLAMYAYLERWSSDAICTSSFDDYIFQHTWAWYSSSNLLRYSLSCTVAPANKCRKLNTSYADSDRSKHGLQQVDEFKLSVFVPLLIRVIEPVTQFWYGSSFCRAEVACPGKVAPKSWCSQFSQYYKFRHMWMWIAHSPVVSLHE